MRSKLLHGASLYMVDEKGRVVIPADFRQAGGSPVVLLPAAERVGEALLWTVLVIGQDDFRREAAENAGLLDWWQTRGGMAWVTHPCGHTGRVGVPHTIRALCGIGPGDEVVVRGMGTVLQLLALPVWQAVVTQAARQMTGGD